MGESRVELLRDFKKSLLDRLPVAVQLYQDESVVFPARRQFLLDWLLDSFYRVLKWTPSEIGPVVQKSPFFKLLENLLQEEEAPAVRGKRPASFTLLSKPLLPIFTFFFTHLDPQDGQHVRQVFDLIGTVAHREDLFAKNSLKYMSEFIRECLAAPRVQQQNSNDDGEEGDIIYTHLGRMVASWASRQGDRRKAVLDMGSNTLELISRIPDGSVATQVLDDLFGAEEVIKELAAALKAASDANPYLAMLCSSPVRASLLLERLGGAFWKRLSLPEARNSILSLFKLLAKPSTSLKAGYDPALYEALATLSFAEVQNDTAWSSLGEYVTAELSRSDTILQDPRLIQAILKVDLGLVIPQHLPDLLSHAEPTAPWQDLMGFMVEGMARIRQLDLLCMTVAKKAPLAIPEAWIFLLVPRLRVLHVQAIEQLFKDLKQLAEKRDTSMPASNAFRLMGALIQAHPQTISRHAPGLLAIPSTNPYYHKLLAVIAERTSDPAILTQLSEYSTRHPKQKELSIILKVRDAPQATSTDFTKLDDESLLRLLPVLGEAAVRSLSRIDLLPPWIFDSLLFWETIDDELLDGLLRTKLESPKELVHVLQRLPLARRPSARVAAKCIKALVEGKDVAAAAAPVDSTLDEALCKLLLVENLELKTSLSSRLFKLGGVLARWLLIKGGLVPLETICTSSAESLKEMLLNLSIITHSEIPEDLQPKLVASFRQHLGSCTAEEAHEMPLLAAAIISRFARCATLADEVRHRLTLADKTSFEAALLELGAPELAQPKLAETIHGFIYSPPDGGLSARDLGRVIKACGQPEELKRILETIRPAAANYRHQSLLDALLLLPVETQEVASPHVDRWLASGALLQSVTMDRKMAESCFGLLTHRLASGGANVAALGEGDVLFGVLQLIVQLVTGQLVPLTGIPSLLMGLFQHHWFQLLRYRPLLIPLLCRLMREVPERCGRLLRDFAQRHRADQQYYVLPLLLEYSELSDAGHRRALRPAMAAVVAVLERAQRRPETGKAPKYFDADPLRRLMRLAPSDDARLVLKELVAAYHKDYKYKGKA